MNSSAMTSPTTSTRRLEKPSMSARRRSRRSASPGSGCTERAISMGLYLSGRLRMDSRPAMLDGRLPIEPLQNPARRAGQVVRHLVGHETRPRLGFFGPAVSAANPDAARPHRTGQRDVQPLVANDERAGRVEAERLDRPIDHAVAGLPAVAQPP